jgi:hypothetical protein
MRSTRAALHLGRGAAREGHQQDAARVGAVDDEVGDAVGASVLVLPEPAPAITSSGMSVQKSPVYRGVFPVVPTIFDAGASLISRARSARSIS